MKIYYFVTEYSGFLNDLTSKISNFCQASFENTPSKYEEFDPSDYWVHHLEPLENLKLLNEEVYFFKEYPVINPDHGYVLYEDGEEIVFKKSSDLLRSFLGKLYIGWKCALSILDELSLNEKYKIGDLDYMLVSFGLDLIPVVNEILNLLHSWHGVVSLEPDMMFSESFCYYTINYVGAISINHPKYVKYINYTKEFWIKKIVEGVLISESLAAALDAGLRRKIEYKYRIRNLNAKSAIEFVFRELLFDIDIKTLQFLALNPSADLEELREQSIFTPRGSFLI